LKPLQASRWFTRRRREEKTVRGWTARLFARFDAFYAALDHRYRGVLAWALGHRWTVMGLGTAALLIVIPLAGLLGFEFMPSTDQGQFSVIIETPAGTNLETTNRVVAQVEELLAQQPEIDAIFTRVGSTTGAVSFGTSSQGPNTANISITLKDRGLRSRSDREIIEALRVSAVRIPGGKITFQRPTTGPAEQPVRIELLGDRFEALSTAAEQIEARVKQVPGTVDVDTSWRVGRPELQVRVDRLKAASLGLSTGMVAATLRTAIQGATDSKFRTGGDEYDIRVRLPESQRQAPEDIAGILIAAPSGQPIYVKDVAKVTLATGPTEIDRKERQRMVVVSAGLAPGYFLGNMQRDINTRIADVKLPAGVTLRWGGEAEQLAESGGQMGGALLLSVILVYILLAALFEGFLSPFIIMFSLPMALVGAILGLMVAGKTLSVVSMIGIIMLMGLVTKNAILLVDYTNTLRARGQDRREAILEAGPTRLRPILMTTLAMIMGMLPTALGLGGGAEFRSPMAVAVIGGLIWSTLLTLVAIPVVYTLIDDFTQFVARRGARRVAEAQG
jgi:HAE1 family hydrophobic/amphiphilic exporter-1